VKAAISRMRETISAPLSVQELSNSVNLSQTRLRQLFKEETGRSPMQYLRDLRMQHAEQLLRTTFFSIKEITFLSGEKDVSHFVRYFKKQYGLTPSEFRVRN
jgi:transcriptional regulator GlxA family with amidase domain